MDTGTKRSFPYESSASRRLDMSFPDKLHKPKQMKNPIR